MKVKPLAICDRCGLRYYYADLQKEWTGNYVCDGCFEEKHPQLEPMAKDFSDPKALENPRPDSTIAAVDNTAFDEAFPHTAGAA